MDEEDRRDWVESEEGEEKVGSMMMRDVNEERVLERALAILGIAKDEARTLATEAVAGQKRNTH